MDAGLLCGGDFLADGRAYPGEMGNGLGQKRCCSRASLPGPRLLLLVLSRGFFCAGFVAGPGL